MTDLLPNVIKFEIEESDRTFLRFLWPLGISRNPAAPIKEFWTRVLDFGLICSPWLHIKGVRYHLERCKRQFPDNAPFIEEVSEDLYMDDVSFQADSFPDAERKIGLLFKISGLAKFPLRKWATSDARIAEMIRTLSPLESTEITTDKADAKFLGVKWIQGNDEIGVSMDKAVAALAVESPTKRSLLKGLAAIFDPLGLLAPVSVRAKSVFQKLWRLGVDWDETLPEEINLEYETFVGLLRNNSLTSIPRCITGQFSADRYELHAFSDASMDAYGCVIYMRTIFQRTAETRFLIAEARVAPNKCKWSIHRYELMGALLTAKIADQVTRSIKLRIDKGFFWCDNMACVSWIHSDPNRWSAFVANRVRDIHKLSDASDWRYVKSEDNPADIVSRGLDISTLPTKQLWFRGPAWLSNIDWEAHTTDPQIEETSEEKNSV
ncbi:uncharacterized protein LOC100903342 [Galendromus occidentalis]|uniref:Uncharacterized protein LOC100903342 n=1 Tax=Galendromus occidentalis TaxID=34638 RepID=A0AAJ6QN17_9ACAR|nr:uncharacterized protein LOC100903342 [Galendromus occidentalis]